MEPVQNSRKLRLLTLSWAIVVASIAIIPILGLQSYNRKIQNSLKIPKAPRSDCGVVLTGGPGRIREGIALLSQRAFKKLIISGVHQRATLADVFPEILFYPEIDLENVILERKSTSTWGNAQLSLPIVDALKCKSVLLITSDYHLYRSMATFQAIFPASITLLPYSVSSQRLLIRSSLFFDPRYWSIIFDEWTKYLFYSLVVF